ncbi:hypothetical protein CEXT_226351 [Caerostris extrusa]|uniref:Uncharacterized protein n=1 Tax=Caerostris extrusa TaxID=172846 RepID=A0AAV4XBF8_CAEEX|nr:hypothetical protein CEXT_226351 [Caerostris extrusa]
MNDDNSDEIQRFLSTDYDVNIQYIRGNTLLYLAALNVNENDLLTKNLSMLVDYSGLVTLHLVAIRHKYKLLASSFKLMLIYIDLIVRITMHCIMLLIIAVS